jgi:hypothetical protein
MRRHHRQLDASVGASEPHGFAVRIGALRPAHRRVHRIPNPTSVTIAKRPSVGNGMARDKPVIWVKWKERYFCEQGWTCKPPNDLSGKSDGMTLGTHHGKKHQRARSA